MEYAKRLVVPAVLLIILVASWMSPLSSEQVDAGLKRSLASFAIARSLNAVISVAQGTDVAIQPAGIGVKFAPGEILDPINDLIETFSTLMLFASISFGVQKVLISVGGHWLVSVALSLSVLLWAVLHVAGKSIPRWCTDLLPDFSTSVKLVKSAFEGRSGHEAAVHGRADHWIPQASRERCSDQGSVQETWF